MPVPDTGRTSSSNNRIPIGAEIGTATGGGKIYIKFNGKETLYTSALLTLLGLVDLTSAPSGLNIPYSKVPKNPGVAIITCNLVENSAGGDTIVDTFQVKLKCALSKIEEAIAGLPGTVIGNKTINTVYIG